MVLHTETVNALVQKILREAEEEFRKAFFGKTKVLQKEGVQLSTSTLTETDIKLDNLLRNRLKDAFPDFGFVTEETETQEKLNEYNWIIDPIDGTANFAHKIPICGISIALWKGDTPIYGIISFPILNERVHAIKGKGVFVINGIPQKKTKRKPAGQPYVLYAHVGSSQEKLRVIKGILNVTAFPMNFQCATYHISLVALGKADCAISVNLPIWDFAAAMLIAEEAGLQCEFLSKPPSLSDPDFRGYKNTFVTGNKQLAIAVAAQMKEAL